VHAARARRPEKVIADVRADLSDAAAVAVTDDPGQILAMPQSFRADLAQGWNKPVRPARRKVTRKTTHKAATHKSTTRKATAKKVTTKAAAKKTTAKASKPKGSATASKSASKTVKKG
jgi:serine-type D-Ala-D-Ala carboxypeptidase